METTTGESRSGATRWLGRIGVLGFAFFFLKGCVWLALPVLAAYGVFSW